jgi:hypothetical protein
MLTTVASEHMILELSNDYGFVILTVVGILAVLAYVYRDKLIKKEKQNGD